MSEQGNATGERDWIREVTSLLTDDLLVEVDSPDTDLFASGVLDSLGLVDLLTLLDERLGVRLSLDTLEMDQISSARQIALVVARAAPDAAPP